MSFNDTQLAKDGFDSSLYRGYSGVNLSGNASTGTVDTLSNLAVSIAESVNQNKILTNENTDASVSSISTTLSGDISTVTTDVNANTDAKTDILYKTPTKYLFNNTTEYSSYTTIFSRSFTGFLEGVSFECSSTITNDGIIGIKIYIDSILQCSYEDSTTSSASFTRVGEIYYDLTDSATILKSIQTSTYYVIPLLQFYIGSSISIQIKNYATDPNYDTNPSATFNNKVRILIRE